MPPKASTSREPSPASRLPVGLVSPTSRPLNTSSSGGARAPPQDTPLGQRTMQLGTSSNPSRVGSASFGGAATASGRIGSASTTRVPLSAAERQSHRPPSSGAGARMGSAPHESTAHQSMPLFDDLLIQSERAIQRNQLKALDQMKALKRVLGHADTLVADLDGGASAVANEGPSSEERSAAVDEILTEMLKRRGSYAETQAKADGLLSLGPALKSGSDEERVKECFFALARSIPSGNKDLDALARELLTATSAEGIEVVHKYIFKGLADTYSNAQELTSAFGHAADRMSSMQLTMEGMGDSFEGVPAGFNNSRKSSVISLSAKNAQLASTKKMKDLVKHLRGALATLALCSSAGLDLCVDLRNKLEVNEASLRNVSKNSTLLAKHARQLQIENESLRAQVFMSGTTVEEQEVNATNIIERIHTKVEAPRCIVMMQVENTQTIKLIKPAVISEALLQIHQWIDVKLPQHKGTRVNYNSTNEPRDVFDAESNPMFAPESYAFEFSSIGPAIEFCVNMQHELLYRMYWSPKLLKLKDFKEVKDASQPAPPGETPSERKRRITTQPPLWRGLRVRMAVHVGVPHVLRPFKKEVVEEARRRKSMALTASKGAGNGNTPSKASVTFAEGTEGGEGSKQEEATLEDDMPDNAPHLAGAAMELTMLVLRRARGGEILLSPKANEAYDDLKFMYPEALSNVSKEERDYSNLKGPNTTASSAWQSEEEKAKGPAGSPSKGERRVTAAEEQSFLRPTDRLWAIVSDLVKNREKPRAPFAYNRTFEVVFPPTAFWRMTDAAQQNLSLFASAAAAPRVEVLQDDDDEFSDFTDDSDDDYIPATQIAAPDLLQIRRPSRKSVVTIEGVPPGLSPEAAAALDAATLGGIGDPVLGGPTGADLLAATLQGGGGGGLGATLGPTVAPGGRAKRRTAAEYEELITQYSARFEAMNRRLQQLEEMNALYGNEVQSTRDQNARLTDRTRIAEKAVHVQRRLRFIYREQTEKANRSAMVLADRLSIQSAEMAVLKADKEKLANDVKRLEMASATMAAESAARDRRHLTNKSVGTMTAADAVLVKAQDRSNAMEAALRGVGGVLGAWVQHLEAIMKPPKESGNGNTAMISPRPHASLITGDLHTRMTNVLQNETIGKVIATLGDRVEGPASLRNTSTSSQLKSTKWDDLVRLSRQTLQNAMNAVPERAGDTPVDITPALSELSTFECIRNICGLMAKGIKSVIEYENLMNLRINKVSTALVNANNAVEASLGGTFNGSSYSGDDGSDHNNETHDGTASLKISLGNTLASAGESVGLAMSPIHLQRLRDAERRVREQDTMISQMRADAIKVSADTLVGEREVEVTNLRLKAMTNKATELSTALRNVRETVGVLLEKLQVEASNAAVIKMRALTAQGMRSNSGAAGGGGVSPIKVGNGDSLEASANMQSTSPMASPTTPEGLAAVDPSSHANEYFLSKIFGDIQALLLPLITDFCSTGGSNGSPAGQAKGGRQNSTAGGGSDAKRSAFYSEGGALATMTPQARAKAFRTGNGMVSHEMEIQNILLRSNIDTSLKDPTVGPTQLAIDRLSDDSARLSKLVGPMEARAKSYAEKEALRRERDAAFDDASWAPVVEKTFNRERYLGDQVRYLKKRHEQLEADRLSGIERLVPGEMQTTLTMEHRIFQKLDEALALGVDVDYAERERAKADKKEEVNRLLTKMRQVEGSSQTVILDYDDRWAQTEARFTGLPPPIVEEDKEALARAETGKPTFATVSTMTDTDRSMLPMISSVSRSVATMTSPRMTNIDADMLFMGPDGLMQIGDARRHRMFMAPNAMSSSTSTNPPPPSSSSNAAAGNHGGSHAVTSGTTSKMGSFASVGMATKVFSNSVSRGSITSLTSSHRGDENGGIIASPTGPPSDGGGDASSSLPITSRSAKEASHAETARSVGRLFSVSEGGKEGRQNTRSSSTTNAKGGGDASRRGGFNTSTKTIVPFSDRVSVMGSSAPQKEKGLARASVSKPSGAGSSSTAKGPKSSRASTTNTTAVPASNTASGGAKSPGGANASPSSSRHASHHSLDAVASLGEVVDGPAGLGDVASSREVAGDEDAIADVLDNHGEGSVQEGDAAESQEGARHHDDEEMAPDDVGQGESSRRLVPEELPISARQGSSPVAPLPRVPLSARLLDRTQSAGERVVSLPTRAPSAAQASSASSGPTPTPASAALIIGTSRQLQAMAAHPSIDGHGPAAMDGIRSDDGEPLSEWADDVGVDGGTYPSRRGTHEHEGAAGGASALVDLPSPHEMSGTVGSLGDDLRSVDRQSDRPRSGMHANQRGARGSSAAEGSRGLQGLIDLSKERGSGAAEEMFVPIPNFGSRPQSGDASTALSSPHGQGGAASNVRSMLVRPYGATRKISQTAKYQGPSIVEGIAEAGGDMPPLPAGTAGVLKPPMSAAAQQQQTDTVLKRIAGTATGALTATHFMKSGASGFGSPASVHDSPMRSPVAHRPLTVGVEEGCAGDEHSPTETAMGKVPANMTALLLRSRASSRPSTTSVGAHSVAASQRIVGAPYTLDPPPEMEKQYDLHRRFFERQSVFGEAAAQMVGLGADAYDRLLLRPVVTPSAQLDASVARELDHVREANKAATADNARVATAHAKQREQSLASMRTASAVSASPSAVAMQHVMRRPITTPNPTRPTLHSVVSRQSVLSVINHSSTAPAPNLNASHPFVGGNGSSFMLPPVEPARLTPVVDPVSGMPVLSRNEHGRPATPVQTPKAVSADGGDRVLVHQARHTKVPHPNANVGSAAPLPPRSHSSVSHASPVDQQLNMTAPAALGASPGPQQLLNARSHTPLGRRSATQQRNPALAVTTQHNAARRL